MNAAIRAVVRRAVDEGWEVLGVRRGYAGLVAATMAALGARDAGGVIQQGGTILGSARCPECALEETRRKAIDALVRNGVDALVVIGGNGSQAGAHALAEMGVRVVGVASTIDNDLSGSDITLGVDTALNIALEAIDRLKTTASSHQRAFLVEVMGRSCGYLALMAGIAGGAEVVLIPEADMEPDQVAAEFRWAYERGKAHAIAVRRRRGANQRRGPGTAFHRAPGRSWLRSACDHVGARAARRRAGGLRSAARNAARCRRGGRTGPGRARRVGGPRQG